MKKTTNFDKKEMYYLKVRAHELLTDKRYYGYIADSMGIPRSQAHFKTMNKKQLLEAITILYKLQEGEETNARCSKKIIK